MQIRRVKNFAEDYLLYPVFYLGFSVVAVVVNVLFWIWDAFAYLFYLLKKK
jgi:hypothetical protein